MNFFLVLENLVLDQFLKLGMCYDRLTPCCYMFMVAYAELPENVKCMSMMDCEAASILQGIQDQMVTLSKDPELKLPV